VSAGQRMDVVTHLTAREFRIRYRRSAIGWLWAVIMPLARLAVLAFVFTRIIPLDVDNYVSFLYTGLLTWLWFSAGVASASTSVVDRSDLLLRPGLDRSSIPLTACLGDLIDYLIAVPLLMLWLAYETGFSVTAVAVVPLVASQFALILGLGLLLAPLHVYFRDVAKVIDVLLLLGFYLTPVLYEPSQIPAGFRWLANVNPMAMIIAAERRALVQHLWPSATSLVLIAAIAASTLLIGHTVFHQLSPSLIDEL
jgi:lipopolysaccharide transport system permease protein